MLREWFGQVNHIFTRCCSFVLMWKVVLNYCNRAYASVISQSPKFVYNEYDSFFRRYIVLLLKILSNSQSI